MRRRFALRLVIACVATLVAALIACSSGSDGEDPNDVAQLPPGAAATPAAGSAATPAATTTPSPTPAVTSETSPAATAEPTSASAPSAPAPGNCRAEVFYNPSVPPMDDDDFVSAISHAIDYPRLDGLLTLSDPTPTLAVVVEPYTQLERLGFDLDRAQELISASRYSASSRPRLNLSIPLLPGSDPYGNTA